jgi:hypothetical protein
MSCHQNARQNHNTMIASKLGENVAKVKYMGMTVIDHNCIHTEIKSNLNFGNACYPSVQNLLSFYLLSKNAMIKIYKIINLSVALYGYETCSLTLREEHGLSD